MKYNPDFHSAVVLNLRNVLPKDIKSSDEQIWNVWEHMGCPKMTANDPDFKIDLEYFVQVLTDLPEGSVIIKG
jgi:hypothetical protein